MLRNVEEKEAKGQGMVIMKYGRDLYITIISPPSGERKTSGKKTVAGHRKKDFQ